MLRLGRACIRWLPLLLAGCVFQCEQETAQEVLKPSLDTRATVEEAHAKAELVPKPAGPAVPWQSLERFTPDALGDYVPMGPVEGRTLPAPNTKGTVGAVKRRYEKDGVRYDVEILDALYAPTVRQIVKGMQGSDRSVEGTVLRGTTVAGHPAVVRWSAKENAARAGVLVAERYVVNVIATPATDVESAVAFTAALALDEIAKIEPPPEGSAAPIPDPAPGDPVTVQPSNPLQ
jgi:hypothetical protein